MEDNPKDNRTNYLLFTVFGLSIVVIFLIFQTWNHKLKEEIEEERMFFKLKQTEDSITFRRNLRLEEEKFYNYKDSLRQINIDKINLNRNQNIQEHEKIRLSLPTASTAVRDGVWVQSWSTVDTLLPR